MSRPLALVLALLVGPAVASADEFAWRPLAVDHERDRVERAYERAMQEGDDAVATAVAVEIVGTRQRLIDRALASYELASRARPDHPEPHFRALSVLRAFHLDCESAERRLCQYPMTPARMARMVEHAHAFEATAGGDPRLVEEVLFTRALVQTRLATVGDLQGARDDYRKLLDRISVERGGPAIGNLAETYMMLGELDRAIETYRRALAIGADLSIEFGLAVALDRDDQGTEARAIIAERGARGVEKFIDQLAQDQIFFVPAGEERYYLALAHEALGDRAAAIGLWDEFIDSGAHPRYADRARRNRDALRARPAAVRAHDRQWPRP